jgi:hypothetical protein
MLVVHERLAGLGGQKTGPVDQVRSMGDQHPATAGGDDLVAVEGEDGGGAERTGGASAVGGAECLGGVGYEWYLVVVAQGGEPVVVGALAVEVHRQHGAR